MKDPQTPEEWQTAVDVAAALRLISSARAYGLITGGPTIDLERCDWIIRTGRARGIRPSRSDTDLAAQYIHDHNAAAEDRKAQCKNRDSLWKRPAFPRKKRREK